MASEIEQKKILRVFQLIRYLTQTPAKSIDQLASYLQTTDRTVRRYLKLLEDLNYPIEQELPSRRWYIADTFGSSKVTFGEEEAVLLKNLLTQAARQHPLTDGILRKLYLHSDIKELADSLLQAHTHHIVEKLALAIREGKRVLLKNYTSVNSQTISNRVVEPLHFTENYHALVAHEPASGQDKHFTTDRIETVEILPESITYQGVVAPPDLFGMVGTPFKATLRLSDRAYHKLIEEYPLAKPYTRKENKNWLFEAVVQDVRGIGRFVLGFAGDAEVLSPDTLKDYLNEKIKNLRF